jgi:PPOX class probable F420-dependent enzyme
VTPEQARDRFAAARVARLATADADGVPHLVPVVFAVSVSVDGVDSEVVYSAVDAKPKRSTALRRLANVAANPRVALLVDHYDDADWDALWWVRADGHGRVLEPTDDEARHAFALLSARYGQYRTERYRTEPPGPVLAVDVDRWLGWSAT